jgi:hypothetical protein
VHRIDNESNTSTLPAPAAVGVNPNGYFTGGNPGGGIPPTIVTADFMNAIQEEIANVILDAGLTLNKTTQNQLLAAINAKITTGTAAVLPVIDTTALVKGSSDATKRLRIEVDGFTTGQTRVITPPNCDLSNFLIQRVSTTTATTATGTTTFPLDDTIPQSTEGDQYMTLSFTPKISTSILEIEFYGTFKNSASGSIGVALFQDSATNASCAVQGGTGNSGVDGTIYLKHFQTSGSTSAITFKIRAGSPSAGTTTFLDNDFGTKALAFMCVKEYAA